MYIPWPWCWKAPTLSRVNQRYIRRECSLCNRLPFIHLNLTWIVFVDQGHTYIDIIGQHICIDSVLYHHLLLWFVDGTDPTGNVLWWIQSRWNSSPFQDLLPFQEACVKDAQSPPFQAWSPLFEYLRQCHSNKTQMSLALANEHTSRAIVSAVRLVFEVSKEKVIPCLFFYLPQIQLPASSESFAKDCHRAEEQTCWAFLTIPLLLVFRYVIGRPLERRQCESLL